MDPATLATLAVSALVRYVGAKAAGAAGRAIDAAVDNRLDRLYKTVLERLSRERRGESTLTELEAHPADTRRQGRLELALEGVIEDDPKFRDWLAATLEDLSERPPAGGMVIRDAGPVAGGNVIIRAGRDASGRDLTKADHHDDDD